MAKKSWKGRLGAERGGPEVFVCPGGGKRVRETKGRSDSEFRVNLFWIESCTWVALFQKETHSSQSCHPDGYLHTRSEPKKYSRGELWTLEGVVWMHPSPLSLLEICFIYRVLFDQKQTVAVKALKIIWLRVSSCPWSLILNCVRACVRERALEKGRVCR